jgi:hypothetical protein
MKARWIALTWFVMLIFCLAVWTRVILPCCTAYTEFVKIELKDVLDYNDFLVVVCDINILFTYPCPNDENDPNNAIPPHPCSGAMIFGATGPHGGPAQYAPYGVCDDWDVLRNINACWLTNYAGCDFNGDGIVNFKDYVIMFNIWRRNRLD